FKKIGPSSLGEPGETSGIWRRPESAAVPAETAAAAGTAKPAAAAHAAAKPAGRPAEPARAAAEPAGAAERAAEVAAAAERIAAAERAAEPARGHSPLGRGRPALDRVDDFLNQQRVDAPGRDELDNLGRVLGLLLEHLDHLADVLGHQLGGHADDA